jgi:hypothetical protein
MTSRKEISWILRAHDSVSATLKTVGQRFAGFAKAGYAFAKQLFQAFSVIGIGAIALGKKFVDAYHVQARAEAKLTAALQATGYAAGFTTEELKTQAAQLQQQTGIADETILSMQAMLATFRNISGENFTAATMAILDMSTVMRKAGQDSAAIEQASIQVGKALNDPIQGYSALGRIGVQFSEEQREMIRALQESGDLMGAQGIILAELNAQFGGAAMAVDKNVLAYDVFRATIGDAQEEIGRAITENMNLTGTFGFLSDKIRELIDSGMIEMWAEDTADVIAWLVDKFRPLMEQFEKINHAVRFVGGIIGAAEGIRERTKPADEDKGLISRTAERLLVFNPGFMLADRVRGIIRSSGDDGYAGVSDLFNIAEDVAAGDDEGMNIRLSEIRARREAERQQRQEQQRAEMEAAQAARAKEADVARLWGGGGGFINQGQAAMAAAPGFAAAGQSAISDYSDMRDDDNSDEMLNVQRELLKTSHEQVRELKVLRDIYGQPELG